MAQVHKVELEIAYPASGSGTAHVEVRSWLAFTAEDDGREFKLRIALFGSDAGEGTPPGGKPLYRFRFPRRTFASIRAVPGIHTRVDSVDLEMSVLDEDPGYSLGRVVAPLGDEVYAVASLSVEARSDIVRMQYAGRPRVLTPIK